MGNSEPGQLVLSVRGRPGALELGEIGDHVEIERGPRKSQHSSWNVGSAAIVQMAHQAHPAEPGGYIVGG